MLIKYIQKGYIMKRLISVFVILAMAFILISCSNVKPEETTKAPETTGKPEVAVEFSVKVDGENVTAAYNEVDNESLTGENGFNNDGPSVADANPLRIRDKLTVFQMKSGIEASAYGKSIITATVYNWETGERIGTFRAVELPVFVDAGKYIVRVSASYSADNYSISQSWYIGAEISK